ncbi:hypothetical protein MA5S0422_2815 [Mycobacteroides abscessus 5S-0422]|nr:hypothetical protein MA5S0422_2815 [Mycobacteroides abscessus 5S-0422]EIU30123.1 hypothetical protein MA5S1212_4539 [Mycobacteroides abscessus 5S-1212]
MGARIDVPIAERDQRDVAPFPIAECLNTRSAAAVLMASHPHVYVGASTRCDVHESSSTRNRGELRVIDLRRGGSPRQTD